MMRFIADITKSEVTIYNVSNSYLKKSNANKSCYNSIELQNYLENSIYIAVLLDSTKSIFEDIQITSNATYLTDGNWIWSGDLNHYSNHHHFLWPNEFLNSVKNNLNVLPQLHDPKIKEGETLLFRILKIVFKDEFVPLHFLGDFSDFKYQIIDL